MLPKRALRPRLVDLATLSVIALTGVLVGMYLQPTTTVNPVASPGASNVAALPSPARTPPGSARPNEYPRGPGPTDPPLAPCHVPDQLPAPPLQPAAPRIKGRNIAMLFTSSLYLSEDGGIFAGGRQDRAVGLWFAPPGADTARLLVAADGGAVLPLGLSPAGDRAAVWYLPARRDLGDPPCPTGIYLLSTTDGTSQLILKGEWASGTTDGPGRLTSSLAQEWTDQRTRAGSPRFFRLPIASFSADGRTVALIDDEGINLVRPREYEPILRLPGQCTSWAWAPKGAAFVAGCQEMTSAWTQDAVEDLGEDIHSLPVPEGQETPFRHWEQWQASTIGYTARGQIRVVRFYGFPTGCESPGCYLPPLAWSVTKIDPFSGAQRSRVHEVDFLTWVNRIGRDARLSADASWVYVEDYAGGARLVSIDSGAIVETRRLGDPVGASSDGRVLFGSGISLYRAVVLVRSLDRTGTRRDVATIEWPQGVDVPHAVIDVRGLFVTQLPS